MSTELPTNISESDRAVLRSAAALGRAFDPIALAAAMHRDIETLIEPLHRARDMGVLVETPGADRPLRFRDARVRRRLLGERSTAQ